MVTTCAGWTRIAANGLAAVAVLCCASFFVNADAEVPSRKSGAQPSIVVATLHVAPAVAASAPETQVAASLDRCGVGTTLTAVAAEEDQNGAVFESWQDDGAVVQVTGE